LEPDVTRLLKTEMRRSGASLKTVVNRYLRIGLMKSEGKQRKPFVVHPRPLGLRPGMNYDNVEDLLETLEGPQHG